MAYGLLVTGGNGILQIDSEGSYLGLQSAIASSGPSISNLLSTDVIFMSRPTNADYIVCNRSGTTASFSNAITGQPIDVNYFVLRRSTSVSITGVYGLQVFNSGGNVCFDSRGFVDSGLAVIDYAAALSLTPGSLITSTKSLYLEMSTFQNYTASYWIAVSSTSSGYFFTSSNQSGTINPTDIAIAQAFT